MRKVKLTYFGEVIGSGELTEDGRLVNAVVNPGSEDKLPNALAKPDLEGLSIKDHTIDEFSFAEPSREMSTSLQEYAKEDLNLALLTFKNYRKGPFTP
jgi:hypothetical protein